MGEDEDERREHEDTDEGNMMKGYRREMSCTDLWMEEERPKLTGNAYIYMDKCIGTLAPLHQRQETGRKEHFREISINVPSRLLPL